MDILAARLVTTKEELTGDAIETWVTVDINIDGKKTSVGRIDPKWNQKQVLVYLEKIKPDILSDISKKDTNEIIDRPDLVTL